MRRNGTPQKTIVILSYCHKNKSSIHLKSKISMKYDITKHSAPKMPTLGKGTECIQLLLSQTSKDMHDPLVPMLFPILGAHISGTEFQYPDLTWKAHYGQMDNPVTDTGSNKAQLSTLVGGPLSPLPPPRRGGPQTTRPLPSPPINSTPKAPSVACPSPTKTATMGRLRALSLTTAHYRSPLLTTTHNLNFCL